MKFHPAIVFALFLVLLSCRKGEENTLPDEPLLYIPPGFPEPVFPEDNAFTKARWELGKKLFYDQRLSKDQSISCASCHMPQFAFSDTTAFSNGSGMASGVRNSPSLANVAYLPYYTREGGVPTLEMQVLVPIQEHNEFNTNILDIVELLQGDSLLQMMSEKAYGRSLDYYVLPRAIASFERSLISGSSPYDQYTFQGKSTALSAAELEGMELFFSDATNCFSCHGGFNFTSNDFENNGLYASYADPGRFRLTGEESDRALFKIPSLRNAALTAPYMHDGSIQTLEAVIEHYNSGGQAHPHKNEWIRPLNLTQEQKHSLLLFIKTLTDTNFINNEKFKL